MVKREIDLLEKTLALRNGLGFLCFRAQGLGATLSPEAYKIQVLSLLSGVCKQAGPKIPLLLIRTDVNSAKVGIKGNNSVVAKVFGQVASKRLKGYSTTMHVVGPGLHSFDSTSLMLAISVKFYLGFRVQLV